MKKAFFIIFICLLTNIFISCSNKNTIVIGFLLPTYEISRYEKDRDFFVNKVKALGGEVLVANAENDDKKQLEQAKELLEKKISVIVVSAVNQNSAASIVREAHKHKVKVIAYERLIQNSDLDYFVTFDSELVGRQMAEYVTRIRPFGHYVLIGGDKSDKNAVLVKQGQIKVIDELVKSGKISILYSDYIEGWSTEDAHYIVKEILQLSTIVPSVILCSNDGMAEGAVRALSEFGMDGKVLVTGQDAELKACQRIVQGTQAMTVYKSFKIQGEAAAMLAVKIAKKEKINETNTVVYNGRNNVPSILLEPTTIDISNIKNTIIADGFYKESEIFVK